MREASCLVSPIPDHAFFGQPQFECLLGDNLLQARRLAPELLDLIGRRGPRRVAGEPALAGLQELLRPRVIHALGDAFAPAEFGDRSFAAQAVKHDADLLFDRVMLAGCAPNVADKGLRRSRRRAGFLSHLRSLGTTMSQKSSVPQAASCVSMVVKR